MKALRVILFSIAAWITSLSTILIISYFNYENPSLADAIGFGGILFFVSIIHVPLCYLPTIHFVKKYSSGTSRLLITLALVFLANIPVYAFLWVSRNKMSYGEGILFLIGFIVFATVSGIINPVQKKILQK